MKQKDNNKTESSTFPDIVNISKRLVIISFLIKKKITSDLKGKQKPT